MAYGGDSLIKKGLGLRFVLSFFVLIFFMCTFSSPAHAMNGERSVEFAWEPIEDAVEYDIELKPRSESKDPNVSNKGYNLKSLKTTWEGFISPGYYWMRIRSRDERHVPGLWSEAVEFNVLLETPAGRAPPKGVVIESRDEEKDSVRFEWTPVNLSDTYQLKVQSLDGKTLVTESLHETEKTIKLPTAQSYQWSVRAVSNDGLQSEESAPSQFLLQGPILDNPEIEKPESPFVRDLKWSKPEHTEFFAIQLDRFERAQKKWKPIFTKKDLIEAQLNFDPQWEGGRYRFSVQAMASDRKSSKISRISFPVKGGDRSEAEQMIAEKRSSIERKEGWYLLASYFVTQMFMSSGSRIGTDTSIITQEPLGGTGRLGLGWQSKISPWGFYGWADLSGFFFNNRTVTFGSVEMNSSYRMKAGDLGEFRLQSGVYMTELPQIRISSISGSDIISDFSSASVGGVHVGTEYWHSLSAKFGFQANVHLYYGFLNLGIANLESMNASINPQFGFMGSYKFSSNWVGLMGYTYRKEELYFTGNDGSENETRMTGHYLSFYTEYYF